METKEELINHIKQWIAIDTEIKNYQKLIREKRKEKKILSNKLIDVMKQNKIDGFNINNGKLSYSKIKTKETVSKKMLLRCLSDYFETDDKVNELTNYILESREVKIKDCINIRQKK
tara:strand:+ start:174 stop:524 length:351 start_codon:yes stop_codon:yes gene_type:complete